MTELRKCNTCLASFPSMEVLKDHYKSDWHCFNSKRRSQSLPILRREQFLELVKANNPKPKAATPPKTTVTLDNRSKSQNLVPVEAPLAKEPKQTSSIIVKEEANPANEEAEKEEREEEETERSEMEKKRVYVPKLGATVSIFDDQEFPTAEAALHYMSFKYGFFLPDLEYLVDLEGMLEYCNEKVKLGGLCLCCQKPFVDGRAAQHHMIAKSHCKLAYETGVDAEEFEDFYDFTATYEDVEEIELDENGEVIQEEATVNAVTGELVLPDGKVLGHRDFRLYYKQYYRPTDTRAPVLAQQREELLRLGQQFGGMKKGLDLSQIHSMSEMEVMDQLIKYQKSIRRGQIQEQKGQQRQEMMSRRKEYKSKIAQLRSSETTTDKIRDWHRML